MCTSFQIEGDVVGIDGELKTEDVELWHRNTVECIEELMGNPAFKGKQFYAPKRVYRNENGTNREYSEMWKGDWWWSMQVCDRQLLYGNELTLRRLNRCNCLMGSQLHLSSCLLTRRSSHALLAISKRGRYT